MRTIAILIFAVACSGTSSQTPPPAPSPEPAPVASGPGEPAGPGAASSKKPKPASGPGLHETCGPGDSCGVGTCMTYYGIAGPRGPQFKTCEIKCDAMTTCPEGTACMTIADGPGQVCS